MGHEAHKMKTRYSLALQFFLVILGNQKLLIDNKAPPPPPIRNEFWYNPFVCSLPVGVLPVVLHRAPILTNHVRSELLLNSPL